MKHRTFGVWISGLLIAALAVGVLAPTAEARGKGSKRYKGSKYGARHHGSYGGYSPRRVVEIHRSSSAGPAIAGFIGGLVVGTIISERNRDRDYDRPAPRYEPDYYESSGPDYDYVDPYCGGRYGSLSSYRQHTHGHRHPVIVRVIEVDTGRCAHTYRYHRGDWVDASGDWEDY